MGSAAALLLSSSLLAAGSRRRGAAVVEHRAHVDVAELGLEAGQEGRLLVVPTGHSSPLVLCLVRIGVRFFLCFLPVFDFRRSCENQIKSKLQPPERGGRGRGRREGEKTKNRGPDRANVLEAPLLLPSLDTPLDTPSPGPDDLKTYLLIPATSTVVDWATRTTFTILHQWVINRPRCLDSPRRESSSSTKGERSRRRSERTLTRVRVAPHVTEIPHGAFRGCENAGGGAAERGAAGCW